MARRDYGTGRVHKTDPYDKLHPMKVPLIKTKNLVAYDTGKALDQKATDMCAGYAWRALLNAPPFTMKGGPTEVEIFRGAKRHDDIPGSDYPGTTARGAAKWLQKIGVIGEYVWSTQAEPILNWMRAGRGPVLLGTTFYAGMYEPDTNTIIRASGAAQDSHLYALTAIDDKAHLVEITNSWGDSWGKEGRAWLPISDLRKLLAAQGEALGAKRPGEKWDGPKPGDLEEEDD